MTAQEQLHVRRSLEFLKDDIIHTRAGFHRDSSDYGQASGVAGIACRTEKALWANQCRRGDSVGHWTPSLHQRRLIGTRQLGKAVQKNHHIPSILHQPLGAFQHRFAHAGLRIGRIGEGGGEYFRIHRFADFRHFFRSNVNQQHQHFRVGIIALDGTRDVPKHQQPSAVRRRDDHRALSKSDGSNQVHEPNGHILVILLAFQHNAPVGIDRHQLVKG